MDRLHIYRHGDVLLSSVKDMPSGKEIAHSGNYTVAYGEVTGHSHRLSVKNVHGMKVIQAVDGIYLCLMEVGTLEHQEHKTLTIEPGIYRIGQEREYSYVDKQMEKVRD